MTVEVCPICDIAGCKHIREKTHPMTHDTPPKRITLEEAQAAVDPRLVAEILRDFGTNFDGVYPVGVLARGVGPEQSMIGLAIKRGHLVTRSHADAMVAAALREAAAIGDGQRITPAASRVSAGMRERASGEPGLGLTVGTTSTATSTRLKAHPRHMPQQVLRFIKNLGGSHD